MDFLILAPNRGVVACPLLLPGRPNSFGAHLHVALLTLLSRPFCRHTTQTDVAVGAPVAGLEHPDLERMPGFSVIGILQRKRTHGEQRFDQAPVAILISTVHSLVCWEHTYDARAAVFTLHDDGNRVSRLRGVVQRRTARHVAGPSCAAPAIRHFRIQPLKDQS